MGSKSLNASVRTVEKERSHWLNKYPRKIRWAHLKRCWRALKANKKRIDLMKNPCGDLPDIGSAAWQKHLRVTAERYQRRLAQHVRLPD